MFHVKQWVDFDRISHLQAVFGQVMFHVKHAMRVRRLAPVSKLFKLSFLALFMLSSCPMLQFQWHRTYFTHSPEEHYALSNDIENSVFDKYSINGTRVFLTELFVYESSWQDRDIVGGSFSISFFTKLETPVTGNIRSNYYRFPRPKDMKYIITVLIEEEKEDGVKTVYEFTYSYYLEKIDRWIRLIGV